MINTTAPDKKAVSILKTLENNDNPLWKTEIHRQLPETVQEIPGLEPFSLQTVSRRIDKLEQSQHINHQIITDPRINQTFIKAYHLTEKGKKALRQYHDQALTDWTLSYIKSLINPNTQPSLGPDHAKKLFSKHYDLPHSLIHNKNTKYIASVIFGHHCKEHIKRVMGEKNFLHFLTSLHAHNPQLTEPFDQYLLD